MKNIILLALSLISLQGCSYIASLVVYNDSGASMEICNLNLEKKECVIMAPQETASIRLATDHEKAFEYSVNIGGSTKHYTFKLQSGIDYMSKAYCSNFNKSFCDIAIQFNSNSTFTWADNAEKHPVYPIPKQPAGFPVEPDA